MILIMVSVRDNLPMRMNNLRPVPTVKRGQTNIAYYSDFSVLSTDLTYMILIRTDFTDIFAFRRDLSLVDRTVSPLL